MRPISIFNSTVLKASAYHLSKADWGQATPHWKSITRRESIHGLASPDSKYEYVRQVYEFNHAIAGWGGKMSHKFYQSLKTNIDEVESGRLSSSQASFREAMVLAGDSLYHLRRLRFGDALGSAGGSLLNLLGSSFYFPIFDAVECPELHQDHTSYP